MRSRVDDGAGREPGRAAILVGVAVFLLLIAVLPGHLYSVDGLSYYRTATEFAWHARLTFDPPFVWGGVIEAPQWPLGLSLAYVLPAILLTPVGGAQPIFDPAVPYNLALLYGDPVYFLLSWVNPLIVAATAAAVVALAREVGLGPRPAVISGLVAALASPLFFYGRADFAQPLTSLLLVVGIVLALRARRGNSTRAMLLFFLVGAWAPATRLLDGGLSFLVWLAILAWPNRTPSFNRSRIQGAIAASAGMAVGLALTMVMNAARRGDPLDFGYGGVPPPDPVATAMAYFLSPGVGLPWHFPLLLLVPVGALWLTRAGRPLAVIALLLPAVLWLFAYAFWSSLGGWSYGPRFLVPILAPLAVLAGAALMTATRPQRLIFWILATLGIAANASLLLVDQLLFWGRRGDNYVGHVGFVRQFEPAAFAPLGSLELYHPIRLSEAADIIWVHYAGASRGLSLLPPAALVLAALVLIWMVTRPGSGPIPAPHAPDGPE